MPDIIYSYRNVPTIKKFSESTKFIRGLMGPFGSGKSSGCIIKLIEIAAAQKPWADGVRRARFACIRNTYPQLRDTTIHTFHRWLPPREFGVYRASDHQYIINRLAPNLEIDVLFRALDRPEHVSNLLSLDLTAAWVNEAREVPWAIIFALQGRVGRYPPMLEARPVDPCILLDTNPPDDESWWFEMFETRKPDNAELFKQPSGRKEGAENLANLPDNYYQNLVQGAQDENEVKVYVDGEYGFVRDGKPVYPEYNDALHCQDVEPNTEAEVYRGWDFGLTPAVTFSQVLPDGRWLTFDELTSEELFIDAFADTVVEHTARKYPWLRHAKINDIGDPAGLQRSPLGKETEAKSCFDVLHGKGIIVQAGEQTLTTRLGSVKRALSTIRGGRPLAVIHSRCKKLRKGYMGHYQFKKVRIAGTEVRYHEEPDKNEWSHVHDANQYVGAKLFADLLRGNEERKKAFAKKLEYPQMGIK